MASAKLFSLAPARTAMRAQMAATPPRPLPRAPRRTPAAARSAYAAARMDGIVDWAFSAIQSADQELRSDLSALRGHSRNHCRNDPYGRRFINEVAINVIGPTGIRMQAQVRTGDPVKDLEINQSIEDDFAAWAEEKHHVTADGRLNWHGLLTNVATTEPQDGELLIRILPGFDNEFGFALQALDPDQLDHTINVAPVAASDGRWTRNAIRMGVEINQWGRPLAYWIHPTHPTDTQYAVRGHVPVRIPADRIIHDYPQLRIGQTRGVPFLAPVLRRGKLRDSFEEAAVVNARIGASKVGLLQADPAAVTDPNLDEDEEADAAADFYMDPEPGTWEILPAGIKPAEGWNPLYPSGEYGPFVQQALQAEAAGYLMSYMTLTGDLKGTSYSSGRIGLLSERDTWRMAHKRKIDNVCRPVLRAWIPWARTMGKLRAGEGVMPAARPPVRWQGRGWAWVDPKKDIDSHVTAVDNILGSRTRALAEQGEDFDDVAHDIARERATLDRLNIPIPAGTAGAPAPPPAADDEPDTAEEAP